MLLIAEHLKCHEYNLENTHAQAVATPTIGPLGAVWRRGPVDGESKKVRAWWPLGPKVEYPYTADQEF